MASKPLASITPSDHSSAPPWTTPGVARRLACFMYEGVLLFGVVMIGGYLFSSLTQQRHALVGRHGLQFFLFLLLGIYFVWFWSRGGQTVAMKAWHIRIVDARGAPVNQLRALVRYLISWLWFVPALVFAKVAHLSTGLQIYSLLTVGVLTYALSAKLHPQGQFWHDAICGTRLITSRPTRHSVA